MQQNILSAKFEEALAYAHNIHAGQMRRKTGMPRIAHLLVVAGTVLEYGGNEAEAISALLHDAVEDAGGNFRLEDIRRRFGDTVCEIVLGCSHPEDVAGLPYLERKKAYIQRLQAASVSVHLVAAADKLHNARALIRGYSAQGEPLWERYRGGREGTLWYYHTLVQTLSQAPPDLLAELKAVVEQIRASTSQPSGRGVAA